MFFFFVLNNSFGTLKYLFLPHCLAMCDIVVIGDMFRRMVSYVVSMHGVTQKLGILGGM